MPLKSYALKQDPLCHREETPCTWISKNRSEEEERSRILKNLQKIFPRYEKDPLINTASGRGGKYEWI